MNKSKILFPLKIKIALTISLLVFVFGGVVIFTTGRLVGNSMSANKVEEIGALLTEQTHETSGKLETARLASDVAAGIPEVISYLSEKNPKPQETKLLTLLTDFSLGRNLAALYLINDKGVALVSTDPTFVGNDFSFRNYVKNALAGNPFGEMAIGSVSKMPGFYFSTPVKNSEGKVIGVVATKLDPKIVFADLAVSKAKSGGDIMFVNSDGVIIYSSKSEFLYKSLFTLSEAAKNEISTEKRYPGVNISALDYEEAMKYVEKNDGKAMVYSLSDEVDKREELVGVIKMGDYPYYLMSESGKGALFATVTQISTILALIIFGALVLGTLIQIAYLSWVMRPLEKLEKYAARVSDGNLDEKIEVKSGDELQSLSESISEMVNSIKMNYADLEEEVKKKTADLSSSISKIEDKNTDLENTKSAIMNVMEDLSEEKNKIAAEKNRIETILRSIGDGVFVTDTEGKVVMVNQAAERITGYSSVEMFGKKYTEVFKFANEDDTEAEYPDFVMEAIKKNKVGSLLPHTILQSKDGTFVPVLDSAAPLKTMEGEVFGCVVVVRDNTHERELERSKDDFLSVTSHQLRTPLGSMRWNLEMLLGGDAGKLGEEATEITKQIYDGNLRMIGLVNDLLNVSRIDQGRVMDEPTTIDLGSVISEAVLEMEPLTMSKNIKINTFIDKKVPKIKIDRKRVREVIENLISNAIKYNKVDGEVEIKLAETDKNIQIEVRDTGMGIPKKDISRLFSRFFRAENAVHSETEGSGLGLYVVKKFVEGWGGRIMVESEMGKGSKFTVMIPVEIDYKMKKK